MTFLRSIIADLNQNDRDAALDFLSSGVSSKDFHQFEDDFNAACDSAEIKTITPQQARETMRRSHSMDFVDDPHSQDKSLVVDDPSIVVSFKGKFYVVDGQHRMADAIKKNKPVKIAVIDGAFLSKYGITENHFINAGKILR